MPSRVKKRPKYLESARAPVSLDKYDAAMPAATAGSAIGSTVLKSTSLFFI